jgi:DNA polymerase IV
VVEPDDSGCTILHVDMDAFFASVEVRRRPELRGKPVVVGGDGPRGVVSSASYEARAFGVRSAMPGSQARRLCPRAVFLPPDMAAYAAASREVMHLFGDITPLVEPLSVDEAFLDVAGAQRLLGRPAAIGQQIRARVAAELDLTCSVGVAATKFLAKLASTRAKPNGMLVVPAATVLDFLHPLPVEALWGVGERTAETLRRHGLRLVGDVAQAPIGMLRQALGEAAARHLHELAWARDPRRVSLERVEKSVSAETTFDTDVNDEDLIRRTMLGLATRVGARLRHGNQAGRTVAIKVRMADFRTLSRSRTLPAATDVAREIFDVAWALFQALQPGDRIRLVGVRVEGLSAGVEAPRQLELGGRSHGWRDAELAADAAAARFGSSVVGPASLLRPPVREHAHAQEAANGAQPDNSSPRSANGIARIPTKGPSVAERDFDPLSDPVRPS